MVKKIRWGILGTSSISETMAQAILASKNGRLEGFAGRSPAKIHNFANKFPSVKNYASYDDLIHDPHIDAIYIGLPNFLHKDWIIRGAKAGKHILCEKPWVINAKEAQEVIHVLSQTNVFFMEALMYRCHPFTKKIQQLVAEKIIGDITFFQAFYAANIATIANPIAGGSIRNLGCYPISLICLLTQSEPIEMKAIGKINQKNLSNHRSSVLLKFRNDSIGIVGTADDLEMAWHFSMIGTCGKIDIISNPWLPSNENTLLLYLPHQEPTKLTFFADKPLYCYQIDMANQSILTGQQQNREGVSWQESLGNIEVLENWLNQISINDSIQQQALVNL